MTEAYSTTRTALALIQLANEIMDVSGVAVDGDPKITFGEPDGLRVIREMQVDYKNGKVIAGLLESGGEIDRRIWKIELKPRKGLMIEVVANHEADNAESFHLMELLDISQEE